MSDNTTTTRELSAGGAEMWSEELTISKPPAGESNSTGQSVLCELSKYFTSGEWVTYGIIVLLGIVIRWAALDYLPLHHDESIHSMFGQYFYDFPEIQYYKYDPEYHGPTLYMLLRVVYVMLGSSDWAARAPIALLGSLALFVPLVFRRYLKSTATLFLTAAVSFSPTLVYWSRFVREDYIIFLAMFLVLYGVTHTKASARSFYICLGIALNYATKANIFVFLVTLIGYLIFEILFNLIVHKRTAGLLSSIYRYIRRFPIQFVLGLAVSGLLFSYLITSGFRNREGIYNGLGITGLKYVVEYPFQHSNPQWVQQIKELMRHDVILYWLDKHNIERIQGPFNFHIYQLSWYELLFMCVFLFHCLIFYKRAGRIICYSGLAWIAIGFVLFMHYNAPQTFFSRFLDPFLPFASDIRESKLWGFFKLKDSLDLVGLFVLSIHALFVTCYHLFNKEKALAFFGYFFTGTLFAYSYLGEKVPWLSSYPLIAGLIYYALYFQDYFEKYPLENWRQFPQRWLLLFIAAVSLFLGIVFSLEDWKVDPNISYIVVGLICSSVVLLDIYLNFLGTFNLKIVSLIFLCAFNFRIAVLVSLPPRDKEMGFISQVHTTSEFRDLARMIRNNIENQTVGYRPLVHVGGDASWPLTWYFRGLSEYKFQEIKPEEKKDYDYLFEDWKDDQQSPPEGFVARKLNLRGWFVPDYSQMTFKKFLNYSINHEPWSGLGFSYCWLYTNKKILPAGVKSQ